MLLIKALRDRILAPLQAVSGIVEKRQALPILSNVLIERQSGHLTFLATDIEMQITARGDEPAPGEPIAITVGARKLVDILRALPETAEVSLFVEDRRLQVRSGGSRFNLQTLPAEDFPRMAVTQADPVAFALPQRQLRRLIGQVQYAMAQQDIRYYLNGLLFSVHGEELRVVATDGHRLAYASEPLPDALPPTECILPRKTVLELSRLLADADDLVGLELTASQLKLEFGGIQLISKLIDGKFPDYDRVLPKAHEKILRLPRAPLLQALSRVAILTSDKFRGVRLVLGPDSLRIMSTNAEQEDALEELAIDYAGEPLDIGFNVTYLLDVLNNVSTDAIECRLQDAASSALIQLPDNERFKYVVMPMRI